MHVKVLYEFKAQPNSGELTIYANEVLTGLIHNYFYYY
jgi:hypothetical protein